MLTIGLTGGVASGKSTVAQLFSELGVAIISADAINRELIAPGNPCFNRIVEHFGESILTSSGDLDKKRLRDIIFSDAKEKHWMQSLLHPLIHEALEKQIAEAKGPYCIVEIPLFNNKKDFPFIDRVLVVDCEPELQIRRLMYRDDVDETQAKSIINAQISREQRLELANDVINNDKEKGSTRFEVNSLHQNYLKMP